MPPRTETENATEAPSTRTEEWRSFLFFTVVMAPVLAVLLVGGYGFLVWMYQLFAGPPGS
jgi:nitrate reductase NapE